MLIYRYNKGKMLRTEGLEFKVAYRIFETHAHYDDESFDEDRDELLTRLLAEDIAVIVNIGADIKTSENSVKLAKKYEGIYAAVGVHPDETECLSEFEDAPEKGISVLRGLASNEKVKAIGEIGLDYYEHEEGEKPVSVREKQKLWFKKQLELAKELNLPVVIHSRDAAEDTYNILKESGVNDGIIHCYSYSPEMAKRFIGLGFFIGIGGAVTFKNAKKAVETVKEIGLGHIVLETDSPYMSPVPFRGKRNNSGNIRYIAEKIAKILEVSTEEVISVTYKNAAGLYKIEGERNGKLC